MPGERHSNEEKAAVMASLLEGQSVNYVAKMYSIPYSTVKRWQVDISTQLNADGQSEVFSDVLLRYVIESVATLTAQARFMREESWLRSQHASELAVLHGVMMDKLMRLAELMARAAEADRATEAGVYQPTDNPWLDDR